MVKVCWHILWVNNVMCRSSCWLVGSRGGDVWNGGGKIALLQQVTVHINLNDNDLYFHIIPGTMIFCLSLFLWRKWGSLRPYLVKPRTCSVVSSSRILSEGWEAAPRTLREWKHIIVFSDKWVLCELIPGRSRRTRFSTALTGLTWRRRG